MYQLLYCYSSTDMYALRKANEKGNGSVSTPGTCMVLLCLCAVPFLNCDWPLDIVCDQLVMSA